MYTAFMRGLADIAEKLDEAAKLGSDQGMPTPYIAGRIEVRLDGAIVGYFIVEDDYVLYEEKGDR